MTLSLSRRHLTAGLLGIAIASTASVGSFLSFEIADYIQHVLIRMLGPFEMAEAEMAAFSRDFTRPIDLKGWTGWMLRAGGWSQMDGVLGAAGPPGIQERFESFDRTLVGAFILSTNYLEVFEAGEGRVVYHGLDAPCANPFARFDGI